MESSISDFASGMNMLVIGSGSIGRRHAKNLKQLGAHITLFDVNKDLLQVTCKENGFSPCTDLEQYLAKEKPDASFICTPSHIHIPVARQLVDMGIDIFIEKPLSDTRDGIDDLIRMVREKKSIAMVGFMLRFEPGLVIIKELVKPENVAFARLEFGSHMPLWRKGVDYRTVYSANRSMGGGTILDDTHELDYACWLFGYPEAVRSSFGRFSSFEIDVEDTAMITYEYPDKLVSIHSDYLQRKYSRHCKICDREGYTIEWTFGNSVSISSESGDEVISYADTFDVNKLYVDEARYFIDCIKHRTRPDSDIGNGYEILKIALAAKHENTIP
jgi:predicted dehydrogenase